MCLVTCCIVCSAEDVFGHMLYHLAVQKMCLGICCIIYSEEDVFVHMLYYSWVHMPFLLVLS